MSYQHKDTPESFWERMRLIHGDVKPAKKTSDKEEQDKEELRSKTHETEAA